MMNKHFIDRALAVDPREGKLPRWAYDKLDTLRRAATEARAELDALKSGTKPAEFYIQDHENNGRFYLPRRCCLKVDLGEGRIVDLSVREGWLHIMGEGIMSMLARPQSANVMCITEQDW